ncbi:hypothetical protein BP00DRAFT_178864 [Aspergillus indologenus CBS 114.80]|uniref:Uncharacterized protein n=1 Tax=Aspergillus indologenus CBS 114.80 TaxID=1450541 RepID=A0A2V5IB09_9EURO|nr:hypothetical protein BP00DRAFT_178864 [Aspergillus indologenus CBS 114.80]
MDCSTSIGPVEIEGHATSERVSAERNSRALNYRMGVANAFTLATQADSTCPPSQVRGKGKGAKRHPRLMHGESVVRYSEVGERSWEESLPGIRPL